jgi:hypothetical protein
MPLRTYLFVFMSVVVAVCVLHFLVLKVMPELAYLNSFALVLFSFSVFVNVDHYFA